MKSIDASAPSLGASTSSVARAFPNIALMKYWGKADDNLHLPTTSSVSITLDICPTTTSVSLINGVSSCDAVFLGQERADTGFTTRVSNFLHVVRNMAADDRHAEVRTSNQIPTAAGLASSAAGFAALATAAADAYGLKLSRRDLSRLARRGSGSAARSVMDGFAIWHLGDDESSYAEPLPWQALDLALVIVGVDIRRKSLPSSAAMRRTMLTSPFYWPWVDQSHKDLTEMLTAGAHGDMAAVGSIAERNALAMHATMLGADPPVRYMSASTIEILDHVLELRAHGVQAYCTMDAGPNVKILCSKADSGHIAEGVRERWPHYFCVTAAQGAGAALIERGGAAQ